MKKIKNKRTRREMLTSNESIELYYKDYIKDILYKIKEDEKKNKENYIEIDEENKKYLLITNGSKYYIWISKYSEKREEKDLENKALVYIFDKLLKREQWITIPDNIIDWGEYNEYLLEGYLFENEMYFSDMIYPNTKIGYERRRDIMKRLIKSKIEDKNRMIYIKEDRGELDIKLGKIINMIELKEDMKDETMKRLLLRNFKHKIKEEYIREEIVNGREIIKTLIKKEILEEKIEEKIIEKGEKIEIYNVYNKDTKDKEGILWVKSLEDSKKLKKRFELESKIIVDCKFDKKRQKWRIYY